MLSIRGVYFTEIWQLGSGKTGTGPGTQSRVLGQRGISIGHGLWKLERSERAYGVSQQRQGKGCNGGAQGENARDERMGWLGWEQVGLWDIWRFPVMACTC